MSEQRKFGLRITWNKTFNVKQFIGKYNYQNMSDNVRCELKHVAVPIYLHRYIKHRYRVEYLHNSASDYIRINVLCRDFNTRHEMVVVEFPDPRRVESNDTGYGRYLSQSYLPGDLSGSTLHPTTPATAAAVSDTTI
jgi:hypothetical protein